jgi:glucose-1-phosphate thymidylyltransferase
LLNKNSNSPTREGSIIIPPCWIDESSKIEKSIVGPYVSVSRDCRISNSIVENSILNSGGSIEDIIVTDSVIGSMAEIIGNKMSVNIGNNSALDLKRKE